MTDQTTAATAGTPSLSVLILNWLSRFLFFNGFYGAMAFVRLAIPTRQAYHPLTFGALAASPFALHMLLAMEALAAVISGGIIAETIKRRRKPSFKPVLPDAVKRRGRRGFAFLILIYAALYASMINPAHIQFAPLIIFAAIAYCGARMTSWATDLLPKAAPLIDDPLSPAGGSMTELNTIPISVDQPSKGKRALVRLWLSQPNSRTMIVEKPQFLRVICQVMAALMLAFGVGLVWINAGFRHPALVFYLMSPLSLLCCIMLLSEASPQRLEIDLVGSTYRYSDYRPIKSSTQIGGTQVLRWPFIMERQTGVLSEDFRGVGIRVIYGKTTTYAINLVWTDASRPPVTVGTSIDESKAVASMKEAAGKLGVPELGRILPAA